MKINPVAIQNYQQLAPRDRAPAQMNEDRIQSSTAGDKLQISPQEETTGSKLAIKPPTGTFAEHLTVEERRALDMLFDRFGDSGRFGPGYRSEGGEGNKNTVGRLVDVKV